MRKFLIGLMLLVCSFNSYSQQIAKGLTATNGQFIGFYEYKPTDYNPTATKKYPLIIFLHGIGERGNGTTELHKITWHAIPRIIAAGGTMTYRNPKTGEMYLTGGSNSTLLVLNNSAKSNYFTPLNPAEFVQPEGIAFSPEGELYIATEGTKDPGKIFKVDLKNKP